MLERKDAAESVFVVCGTLLKGQFVKGNCVVRSSDGRAVRLANIHASKHAGPKSKRSKEGAWVKE